jgi:AraC-like DNA-binding protein
MSAPSTQPAHGGADEPLMSAHFSRLIAREIGIGEKGLAQLLQGTGVEPDAFIHDDVYLTVRQQTIISLNALRLSGDPGLGLRVGKLLAPEIYGPMGILVSSSPTLRTAIEHFATLVPTRIPFATPEVVVENQTLVCRLRVRHIDSPEMLRAAFESIAISLLSIVRSVVGENLQGVSLTLPYPAPPYIDRYLTFLPIPVAFDASEGLLRIPGGLASTLNPMASRSNYTQALRICSTMLGELAAAKSSTRRRVQQALLAALPGTLGENEIAKSLFVSQRTLARRLLQEGTTFRLVREEALAEIAARQLLETNATVESIAALLSYYDASNFRRAFKRWYGVTPDEYRRQCT